MVPLLLPYQYLFYEVPDFVFIKRVLLDDHDGFDWFFNKVEGVKRAVGIRIVKFYFNL